MLLFLDTEFTDFRDCSLISIGLVSEDGSFEFYGERTDFDYEACNTFVRSHVWAHLGMYPGQKFKKLELERRLAKALAALAAPLSIAYDSDRDRQLMMGLFESNRAPEIAEFVDLRQLQCLGAYTRAEAAFFSPAQPQHHALFDAKANRAGWEACGGLGALRGNAADVDGAGALRSAR
jgi:hypothetical protein